MEPALKSALASKLLVEAAAEPAHKMEITDASFTEKVESSLRMFRMVIAMFGFLILITPTLPATCSKPARGEAVDLVR